ncbi:MAG: hypothetical protein L6R37_001931 [Teloschistes peruensis]|nr:MAG: hypothetical protein L6R37_001931 [Teloschistes peruensis]
MNTFLLILLTLLTLYVTCILLLRLLPPNSPLQFPLRTLTAYLTLLLCATYGTLISLLLRLPLPHPFFNHRQAQHLTALAFASTMRHATSVSFHIIESPDSSKKNLTAHRPCVIVGNHQSELDVLLLAHIFPPYCSVTAKKSLKLIPFLGWFMALSGTVFIDRTNTKSARQAFTSAADEMLQHRQSVFIFPEGTRSYARGPEMGQFKKGAFHLAVQAQCPVVPVVCANYWKVLGGREGRFGAGVIGVKVLEPVETKGLGVGDVEALAEEVRGRMLRVLVEMGEG